MKENKKELQEKIKNMSEILFKMKDKFDEKVERDFHAACIGHPPLKEFVEYMDEIGVNVVPINPEIYSYGEVSLYLIEKKTGAYINKIAYRKDEESPCTMSLLGLLREASQGAADRITYLESQLPQVPVPDTATIPTPPSPDRPMEGLMYNNRANVKVVDDATLRKVLERRIKRHASLWKKLAKRCRPM